MLIEVVREVARATPEHPLVISTSGEFSAADCYARAAHITGGLSERGIDRFGCILDDVGELLALLCASTATGAEACVYGAHLDESALADLATRFDHEVVVSDRELDLENVEIVSPDALAGADAAPTLSQGNAPVLILTTGTTGRPKAARHDWGRLVDAARRWRGGERWLLAYNAHQFAGIQMLLQALVTPATLVVPRSNQPHLAVDAMRAHGVTHASATPTFWKLVVSLLDETAAATIPLRQITLGGEAVPAGLVGRLQDLFPQARVSQVYASTEFGSSVSVTDRENGLPLSVLDRDEQAITQMKLVEGELWIRSAGGMLGYYGEPDRDEGWHPTGDLVEVRDDRIHFVGRTSDTINVGGVKVHPLPVEELVGALDGVELVRAYGRKNPVTGQIVAVDVVAREGTDTETLEDAIRAVCESLPPAVQPRRIRFVPELELRGQKLVR